MPLLDKAFAWINGMSSVDTTAYVGFSVRIVDPSGVMIGGGDTSIGVPITYLDTSQTIRLKIEQVIRQSVEPSSLVITWISGGLL